MAKSARASSRKANNRRLKKNVFGPVEAARVERLSAKLQALVAQERPRKEADVNMIDDGEKGMYTALFLMVSVAHLSLSDADVLSRRWTQRG